MFEEIYLDNSATTKPYPEVVEIVQKSLVDFYNPSAIYGKAIAVSKSIEDVRKLILKSIYAKKGTVIFTSGGTESINAALGKNIRKGQALITTVYEHDATMRMADQLELEGYSVIRVKAVGQKIQIEDILDQVDDHTGMVSVMHVNNEIGNIIDIEVLGKAIKKKNNRALFHVDAIQSYMKLKINVEEAQIDLLSISGHKIHGIKGTGALYIRQPEKFRTLIHGGGQEQNLRSGTENVSGILALGKAVEIGLQNQERNQEKLKNIHRFFLERLAESGIGDHVVNSQEVGASHILNISFLGVPSEILLHTLESEGIFVSSGSACSSKKKGSRTLEAIGAKDEVRKSALRFSFCPQNEQEEILRLLEVLKKSVQDIRKITKYKKQTKGIKNV